MKVGKALYNILSQSTDVQSNFPFNTTDYSPTGTELVKNGKFTDTGSELVTSWTNSDFTSFTSSGSDITKMISSGSGQNCYSAATFTSGKSYKLQFTSSQALSPADCQVRISSSIHLTGAQLVFNQLASGLNEVYFVANSNYNYIGFYGVSAFSETQITNFTVKELGADWTLGTGWSIGEDKLIANDPTGYAYQSGVFETLGNKSYKISLKVLDYSSGSFKVITSGTTAVSQVFNANGEYEFYLNSNKPTGTEFFFTFDGDFVGSITNVSVEEMAVNKIFPELAPPDIDAPYIVYSVVSNSPSETKNTNGDIDTANIEVYGFQDTYNKAVDLGVSVRAALDRKTGTYNTIEIQSTNYVNEQMDVNEARKLWAAIQDYSIRIKNI